MGIKDIIALAGKTTPMQKQIAANIVGIGVTVAATHGVVVTPETQAYLVEGVSIVGCLINGYLATKK